MSDRRKCDDCGNWVGGGIGHSDDCSVVNGNTMSSDDHLCPECGERRGILEPLHDDYNNDYFDIGDLYHIHSREFRFTVKCLNCGWEDGPLTIEATEYND